MTATIADESAVPAASVERRGRTSRRTLHRFLRQRAAVVAGLILLIVFGVGAFVPHFAPLPTLIDLSARWRNHPPTLNGWHLLGTDGIGRSVLSRTLYALHTSEQTALYGTLIATTIGVVVGGVAGFRSGWLDSVLMRLADMLGFLPSLMLLLAAYTFFRPVTVFKATIILACYLWIPVARVVRSEVASIREREFVEAARSLGASEWGIFRRHVLPNASGTIVVAATALLGQIIMLEATVEFFKIGVTAEITPTIGNLIGDSQSNVFALGWGWWTWASPAVLLVIILVCANLFGDGVAAALRRNQE